MSLQLIQDATRPELRHPEQSLFSRVACSTTAKVAVAVLAMFAGIGRFYSTPVPPQEKLGYTVDQLNQFADAHLSELAQAVETEDFLKPPFFRHVGAQAITVEHPDYPGVILKFEERARGRYRVEALENGRRICERFGLTHLKIQNAIYRDIHVSPISRLRDYMSVVIEEKLAVVGGQGLEHDEWMHAMFRDPELRKVLYQQFNELYFFFKRVPISDQSPANFPFLADGSGIALLDLTTPDVTRPDETFKMPEKESDFGFCEMHPQYCSPAALEEKSRLREQWARRGITGNSPFKIDPEILAPLTEQEQECLGKLERRVNKLHKEKGVWADRQVSFYQNHLCHDTLLSELVEKYLVPAGIVFKMHADADGYLSLWV